MNLVSFVVFSAYFGLHRFLTLNYLDSDEGKFLDIKQIKMGLSPVIKIVALSLLRPLHTGPW